MTGLISSIFVENDEVIEDSESPIDNPKFAAFKALQSLDPSPTNPTV